MIGEQLFTWIQNSWVTVFDILLYSFIFTLCYLQFYIMERSEAGLNLFSLEITVSVCAQKIIAILTCRMCTILVFYNFPQYFICMPTFYFPFSCNVKKYVLVFEYHQSLFLVFFSVFGVFCVIDLVCFVLILICDVLNSSVTGFSLLISSQFDLLYVC